MDYKKTINFHALLISDSVITDLIVFKKCVQILKDEKNCSILYTNSSSEEARYLQNITQPQVASLIMYKSSIETFFPMIFCLFLGPWSDKNGRKPLLLFPFIGKCIIFIRIHYYYYYYYYYYFFFFNKIFAILR